MLTALFVAGRIVASPATNVFQKRLTNQHIHPLFIVCATQVGLTLVAAPLLLLFFPMSFKTMDASLGLIVLAMGVCEALGNVLLVKSLQGLDISVFGPLNSFKPAMGMVLGMVVLAEMPSLLGALGLVIIIMGSVLLRTPSSTPMTRAMALPVVFRFLAMLFAALGAVLSKQVILAANAVTALFFWIVLQLPVLGFACVLKGRSFVQTNTPKLAKHLFSLTGVILSILLMQALTLLTFRHVFVGYALALFQLSTLLCVLIGGRLFSEPYIGRRLLGAIVMLLGAVLVIQT